MNAVQPEHEHPEQEKKHIKKYGAYQNEIYAKGMFHNVLPTVTTDPNKLEEQARNAMNRRSYNYVAGGAGERATMDANRLAFRTWKVSNSSYCRLIHVLARKQTDDGLHRSSQECSARPHIETCEPRSSALNTQHRS